MLNKDFQKVIAAFAAHWHEMDQSVIHNAFVGNVRPFLIETLRAFGRHADRYGGIPRSISHCLSSLLSSSSSSSSSSSLRFPPTELAVIAGPERRRRRRRRRRCLDQLGREVGPACGRTRVANEPTTRPWFHLHRRPSDRSRRDVRGLIRRRIEIHRVAVIAEH